MNGARVYLDHAATTPLRDEAFAAMAPWLHGAHNASALHTEGRAARAAIDEARETVAAVLKVAPGEIVFTGGGSEADNLAVLGVARARRAEGRHVVTAATEHHAVLHACDALEAEGWSVTRLPVDRDGRVDPGVFAAALRADTVLAAIMLANNEIGTIAPVAELAAIARARGVVFHTDAVQAAGWLALDVHALGVDTLALSAHKFGGPRGAGVLAVRSGTPLLAQAVGGGQERGRRAGTENVAAIAGLACALALAEAERHAAAPRVAALRDRLARELLAAAPGAFVVAADAPRTPPILGIAVPSVPSDALLAALDLEGIAASAGSACAAGSLEPSHVATALGIDPASVTGVLRFSLGRTTTDSDIVLAVEAWTRVLTRVRPMPAVR